MNDFMTKVTDVVQALIELALIDDTKNPPCTLVLQSGISTQGWPAASIKMWLPVEGERGKLEVYELNSEATPEEYTQLLDRALASLQAKIRRQQRGLN